MSRELRSREGLATRRHFLATVGAAGVGLAFADQLLAGNGLTPPPSSGSAPGPAGVPNDGASQFAAIPGPTSINTKVLNFALSLEILEADLYRQALNIASNKPVAAPLNSNPATYTRQVGTGGLTTQAANVGFLYLQQFAYVEAAHRDFFKSQLGGGNPLVPAAGKYKFPGPVSGNIAAILGALLPLEETGVRAYLGALPYLTDLNLAAVAGGIYSTECRHSAAIEYILGIDPGPAPRSGDLRVTPIYPAPNTFEYYLKPSTVIQAVGQFFA